MYRVAYLCCELKGRDLESRLLIASRLLDKGYAVVVGQAWALVANAKASRNLPGVYLFCTSNQAQAAVMSWVVDGGHTVVASDEEALPLVDSLVNVSEDALKVCKEFFVDSEDHRAKLSAAFPRFEEKLRVTGSPRLEAMRSADIEPTGGQPYVLFNTGFGLVNSLWGDVHAALSALQSAADISPEEARIRLEVERAGIEGFKALIRATAPLLRVVIRPHPSERAQTWRDDFPQVEVVEGSPSLPWIKSAKIVVHANSTTGLEAAMLNVPAINFDPVPAWGARFLVGKIGYAAHKAQDAADLISALLSGDKAAVEPSAPTLPLLMNGATKTAEALAALVTEHQPLPDTFPWFPMERAESHKTKFTVRPEEVIAYLQSKHSRCTVGELDDSVFLLKPRHN
jgi:surface carbohydrate biosynthesis protein